MSAGKRKPSPTSPPPRSLGRAAVHVVETPCSIDATTRIDGVGQSLFLLFRDELQAFRQRQLAAATTPAREVSRV
jgi:hypothetical protein